jgi:hypothetical protein
MAPQLRFQITRVVVVKQCPDQSAIKVGRSKQPVRNRECQVHVGFHHQPGVMVRGVMTAQSVHEGTVTHEPILVDMATEVHELVKVNGSLPLGEYPGEIVRLSCPLDYSR